MNIAYVHNEDHIMGERIDHIATGRNLSPEGNYSHMDMVRERVVDGEVQPGGDEGDGGGGHAGGGQGGAPFFFLGNGATVEIDPPPNTAIKGGGDFVVPLVLGFL